MRLTRTLRFTDVSWDNLKHCDTTESPIVLQNRRSCATSVDIGYEFGRFLIRRSKVRILSGVLRRSRWKAHLSSEEQRILCHGFRKEELWRPKKGAGPNHLWDCAVYATAAAELVGVGRLEAPIVKPTKKPQEPRRGHN